MKKIVILIIMLFLVCDIVKAEEKICSYSGSISDSNLKVTFSVNFDTEYNDPNPPIAHDLVVNFSDGISMTARMWNLYSEWEPTPGNDYKKFYNGDYKTLKQYYNSIGSCPPYALTAYNNGHDTTYTHVVVLSDYANLTRNNTKITPLHVLQLDNPPQNTTAENSSPTESDMFVCQYDIEVKYANDSVKYKPSITIHKKENKIASPSATIIGDNQQFIDYINGDCKNKKIYMCADKSQFNSPSRMLYLSKDLETMLDGFLSGRLVLGVSESDCNNQTNEDCIKDLAEGYSFQCDYINETEKYTVSLGKGGCYVFDNTIQNLKDGKANATDLERLRKYCNTLTNYADYSSNKDSCIYKCLRIKDYLPGITSNNSVCGFSQKLALYIRNIVKWVKYIIPVIVIVLGILDFIKAIAADKEDEIKKAQGRFVKRLIAAALIFIVPLIIGFVLDKMGFEEYVSGCGIIDL